jgi:hypothetical protein
VSGGWALLRRRYAKWYLLFNESRNAVASIFGRRFIDCSPRCARWSDANRKVAKKQMEPSKQRIPEPTGRSGGPGMAKTV